MTYLTLEHAGQEKSFAAWGIAHGSDLQTDGNQSLGQFRCSVPAADIAAAPAIPFGGRIIVRVARTSANGATNSFSAGRIVFQGARLLAPQRISPDRAGTTYEFVNAWHDLENTLYQQKVASHPNLIAPLDFPFVPDLTLFAELDAASLYDTLLTISTGQQITNILQFALDHYALQGRPAPFQISPDIQGVLTMIRPPLPAQQMSCATAIQKCLGYHPDCVLGFNYATTPPTAEVRKRSALAGVYLPYKSLVPLDGVTDFQVTRRDDLVPACVIVRYRIAVTVNGASWYNYATDKFGPHGQNSNDDPDAGYGVIADYFDVAGFNVSGVHLATSLDCEPVLGVINGTNAQRIAWWIDARGGGHFQWRKKLNAGEITDLQISLAEITDDEGVDITAQLASFPNQLIKTPVHSWMTYLGNPVIAQPANILAYLDMQEPGKEKRTHYDIWQRTVLTNAVTGNYRYDRVSSTNPGEGLPGVIGYDANGHAVFENGIARILYDAMSELQYECEHVAVADVCPGNVTLFNVVGITGGPAEWSTMRAMVQQLTQCHSRGETSLRLGPAKPWTSDDLASVWRMNQWRRNNAGAFILRATAQNTANDVPL